MPRHRGRCDAADDLPLRDDRRARVDAGGDRARVSSGGSSTTSRRRRARRSATPPGPTRTSPTSGICVTSPRRCFRAGTPRSTATSGGGSSTGPVLSRRHRRNADLLGITVVEDRLARRARHLPGDRSRDLRRSPTWTTAARSRSPPERQWPDDAPSRSRGDLSACHRRQCRMSASSLHCKVPSLLLVRDPRVLAAAVRSRFRRSATSLTTPSVSRIRWPSCCDHIGHPPQRRTPVHQRSDRHPHVGGYPARRAPWSRRPVQRRHHRPRRHDRPDDPGRCTARGPSGACSSVLTRGVVLRGCASPSRRGRPATSRRGRSGRDGRGTRSAPRAITAPRIAVSLLRRQRRRTPTVGMLFTSTPRSAHQTAPEQVGESPPGETDIGRHLERRRDDRHWRSHTRRRRRESFPLPPAIMNDGSSAPAARARPSIRSTSARSPCR